MNDDRDHLSTADLAGQAAGRTQRDGYDGPDRSTDQPGFDTGTDADIDTAPGPLGGAGDPTGPADAPAYVDPTGRLGTDTGYDRDGTDPTGTDTGRDTPGIDRDRDRDRSGTDTGRDLDRGLDRGLGRDTGRDIPGADVRRDTDDPDRRSVGGTDLDPAGGRPNNAGPGPVRTDLPPAGSPTAGAPVGRSAVESTTGPLLGSSDSEGFRARWTDVQTGFVDAPREAVQKADALVAELMQHLAGTFADERGKLEHQWDRGDDVPTDDLRDAFQRYRSFFERLLST